MERTAKVITRVEDEDIWIGEVRISVLAVRGRYVKLRVEAPKDTEIHYKNAEDQIVEIPRKRIFIP